MSSLYSIAFYAERNRVAFKTGTAIADSLEQAKEQGRDTALKLWAVDDGWHGHECSAQEIRQVVPGLYSVALFAENEKRFRVNAGSVVATSLDKAKSLGLDKAMQLWPPDDGWYGHQCLEGEVKQEMAGQIPSKEQESDSKIIGTSAVGKDVAYSALRRLAKVDTSKIQEVVASQVELLFVYHNLVLDQARRSFLWALIAAGVGLTFFLAAVGFLLLQQSQPLSVVSLISGALVEVISGINFYLYGKTSAQLADFQIRLDMTQRFMLANSICESLDGDAKNQARSELVKAIAGIAPPQK